MDDRDNPPPTFGRGGRGALLQAALKNLPRPPGVLKPMPWPAKPNDDSSSSSEASGEPSKPMGRGILLQNLDKIRKHCAMQSTGMGDSPKEPETLEDPPVKPFFGRGFLANLPKTEPPTSTLGRGYLLQQRSAQPSLTPSVESSSNTTSMGRGHLLRQLSSPKSEENEPSLTVKSPTPSVGRGYLAKLSPLPQDRPSPSPSIASGRSTSSQMEDAPTIGRYSGSGGKPIDCEVNYIWLKVIEGKSTHEYHVKFEPAVESKSLMSKMLSQPQVKEIIGNVRSFDGSMLYLPIQLTSPEILVHANLPTDNSEVLLTIKYVKEVPTKELLHLYNILFKKIMSVLNLSRIGRNFFDQTAAKLVPQHKLEIWPGWVFSVQDYEGGIMLNCDASFRVLRTVTAWDVMKDLVGRRGDMKEQVASNLLNSVVLTRYNNNTYRIDGIEWNMTPESTFTTHRGQELTFMEYYKRNYDITIQDTNQPLLVNMPKRKPGEKEVILCLVPELCYMTGLTDTMRNDRTVMKDMGMHTRITPNQRQVAMQHFIDNINRSEEARKILSNWNLKLDNATVNLPGRLLERETILVKNSSFAVSPQADWSRDISNSKMLVAVNLQKWIVVHTRRDAQKVTEFLQMMRRVGPNLGIQIYDAIRIEVDNDRTESYCNAIRDNVSQGVQMVMIIMPSQREDRYNAVKKLCCIEMPVPSQVVNVSTISKFQKLRSVTQKIIMQMNCKVGGELWALPIPLKNIMVCGIDAYHDVTNRSQSVLAFVSSINPTLTRWYSITAMQKSGQEIGDTLKSLFVSALTKYYEVNHMFPQKIFIYRDGVGDGMLDVVLNHEVQQLKSCFDKLEPGYCPKLSVAVVQKRINTRIYALNNRTAQNPMPGSVIDHTVTSKRWFDFFLVSQHVNQGTVSPTHYIIVYDDTNLKPEFIQRLAYKMTFYYYNWAGTVRIPAPCLYAHKLAYLVGQNIHKGAHALLSDKLFYL